MELWLSDYGGFIVFGFFISVSLFWYIWFKIDVPGIAERKPPGDEGLMIVVYINVGMFHIAWLGKTAR